MTKTDLVNAICKIDPKWEDNKGRLYCMTLDKLLKFYKKKVSKNGSANININSNTPVSGFQTS